MDSYSFLCALCSSWILDTSKYLSAPLNTQEMYKTHKKVTYIKSEITDIRQKNTFKRCKCREHFERDFWKSAGEKKGTHEQDKRQ